MAKIIPADDFIDLRRGIDHIGVSAVAIIHDGKGKILLHKRGPKARDERGSWDICGGAIEFGETLEEAITREIKEELCTDPLDMEFLKAFDAHRTNHEGDKTHWIAIVYSVLVDPKKVKIGEPHKMAEIGWFTRATLPSPKHSQLHKALAAAETAGIIK
jgi:ADP-ribose pyrophosphatase YjhB (NUDIX family)